MSGRRILTLLLAVAGALLAVVPALAGGKPGTGPAAQPPTDQIVIRLAPGRTLDTSALDATAGVDLTQLRRLGDGSYVLKLPKRKGLDAVREITAKLAARGDILSAEPDAMMQPLLVPNDPYFGTPATSPNQWDLFDPVATGFYGANLPGAWDITTGVASVRVGVIDTGNLNHEDLAGRFISGYDFIGDSRVANDGNGRDNNPSDPGDWISTSENASGFFMGCGARSSSWHGTHVSGTIGAVANNGLGVAGINWVSPIQPLRVLGKCGGYTSDIADAIRWSAGLPVNGVPNNSTPDRVVNISLGGSGACDSTTQNAINDAVAAGTVVVVAAGNGTADASSSSPANCANVITVAATGYTGQRAYYSNYGPLVEIAAPGGDAQLGGTILSTLNTGTTVPAADTYAYYQGTSMATPHVVGVVSLMLSANSSLTPAQVTTILQATATKFPTGSSCTSICGAGIVNAAAAVAAAKGGTGSTPPAAFDKLTPVDMATVAGPAVNLTWAASGGATKYSYCVDTVLNTNCDTNWVDVSGTSATPTLLPGTTYYWHVTATNEKGTTPANGGTWWMFKTQPVPTAPGAFSKSSPAGGATNQKTPLTLRWASSTGATSYEWCLSPTAASCTTWKSTTGLSASTGKLSSRTTYYWQVRAKNAVTTTEADAATWWTFKTR